ncbi:MAG: septum formation initiator family protein [Treponema sp.]|jgi:cell division protein FtsL|nr:septum formation initiator family protein [Treponema sp.]
MIRRCLFYFLVITVPLFLALLTWQSARYGDLERELQRLEKSQEEWVENNKRLIAGIVFLSSPDRIEHIARDELGLEKKRPEEVLHISIGAGTEADEAAGAMGAAGE